MNLNAPLWTPSPERMAASRLTAFMNWLSDRTGRKFADYDALHAWSVEELPAFWDAVWDDCGVIGEKGAVTAADLDKMPGGRFFPEGHINFAENLLRKSGSEKAIVFRGEDKVATTMSWDELRALVSRLQQAMRDHGVSKGDRVAAMMPNMPQTVAAMLATVSIGAIWSSCSPDFGEQGVLDRFGQIEPKLFIACDGYWYNGKHIDIAGKLAGIIPILKPEKAIIVPYAGDAQAIANSHPEAHELDEFIAPYDAAPLEFERVEFAHPLYILFSSGTTGIPKCIVHSQGGTLLKHLCEHQLHSDLGDGDFFWFVHAALSQKPLADAERDAKADLLEGKSPCRRAHRHGN